MQFHITIPATAQLMLSDLTDWDRNPLDVSDLKDYRIDLADDVYFEYAFVDGEGEVFADPLNHQVAENPWTKAARVLKGPDYQPAYSAHLSSNEVSTSRLARQRWTSHVWQDTRRLTIYTPLGFEHQALPVVLVQDGPAYYRVANCHVIFQYLLNEGLVRPAHLVFIEPQDRTREYFYSDRYEDFVIQEIVPRIRESYAVSEEWLLLGASLGGLASMLLAWRQPELFSTVMTQSGAFLGSPYQPDIHDTQTSWLYDQVTRETSKRLRVYLDVGRLEWLQAINERIATGLAGKDYEVYFEQRNAGHNWVNWRNGLHQALQFGLTR